MTAYQAAATAASALTPVTPLATTTDPGCAMARYRRCRRRRRPRSRSQAAASSPPFQSTGLLQSIDSFLGTPSVLNGINGAVNTAAWFVMNAITTAVSLGHTLAGAAVPSARSATWCPKPARPAWWKGPWCDR